MRLNAFLARAGDASRRRADDLNTAGRLTVNAQPGRPTTVVGAHDRADVEGDPDDEALQRLRDGVELDDGRTAPARARRLGRGRVELVLHEGRKHQVKRMLAAVGLPVTRLHRSGYAGVTLEGLEPGACRELEPSEVKRLTDLPASQPGSAGSEPG